MSAKLRADRENVTMKVFIPASESFVGPKFSDIRDSAGREVSGMDAARTRRLTCQHIDPRD